MLSEINKLLAGPYFLCFRWDLFNSGQSEKSELPIGEQSPIRLLVKTGLADYNGEFISFPEFVTKTPSHQVHPIVRMAAWVKTIWVKRGFSEKEITPILGVLSRLQLVDQAKFPFITSESDRSNFSSWDVYSKSGDFTDVMWLADSINYGYIVVFL